MAVTRLERKGRKNKTVAKKRTAKIKLLSTKPVIKNVDIDAIKAEFEANKSKAKTAPKKEAAKVEEAKTEEVTSEVKEEKPKATKPTAKKAAPKKAVDKKSEES
jgi:hypothetical protein